MTVGVVYGLAAAGVVVGPVAVIDTFRAFTTAAYLLDSDVGSLLLASDLEEARGIAADHAGAILCGEDGGVKPPDFDLGNSPAEVLRRSDLAGRVVVQRTSAGTRCVRAAQESGAKPLFAASLVVASATSRALHPGSATIVASGRNGRERVAEDDVTADYIASQLKGTDHLPDLARIRHSESAELMRSAPWADPDDLELCLETDRFDFAMEATVEGGTARLRRFEPGRRPAS